MGRTDPVVKALRFAEVAPTPAEVRTVLAQIADELEAVNHRQADLWAARRVVYEAGRALDPPITLVELAAAARVSQPQVNRALSASKAEPG